MSFKERWQIIFLVSLILVSVSLTKFERGVESKPAQKLAAMSAGASQPSNFDFKRISPAVKPAQESERPERIWNVLDPQVKAQAVLIQSLDKNSVLFSRGSGDLWPAASLTKLLSAVAVIEEIGLNKKIPVSRTAVLTEGEAGDLAPGEIYTSRDLLKIMLLTSSNDAAAAFEEYLGGKSFFAKILNKKAEELGMTKTIFHDASGLDDLNETTAADMAKLAKYVLEKFPDLFAWSRLSGFLVQPINEIKSRMISNINNFVADPAFLGGKTGTSPEARENLVGIFSFANTRLLIVVLGSPNRAEEVHSLLAWLGKAYNF